MVPRRCALILLDLEEPQPGIICQITGSQLHLFFLHDALSVEVRLALVDEGERIKFPIKLRKIHLELWHTCGGGGRAPVGGGGGGDGATVGNVEQNDEYRQTCDTRCNDVGYFEITRPYVLPRA